MEMAEPAVPGADLDDYFPVDDGDVLAAVYGVSDWEQATRAVAEYLLRDVVARRSVHDLFEFHAEEDQLIPRQRVRMEVRERLNDISTRWWGTEVTWVDIGSVDLPDEVRETLQERWMTEYSRAAELVKAEIERDALRTRGEGQARAIRTIEAAKADARVRAIDDMLRPITEDGRILDQVLAARYLTALEKLCSRIMAEDVTAVRYIEALERLAESGSLRFIGPGPTKDILISLDE
jgi:regulator of protease activity HflC (stomatin/prohibitin superfamily)